MSDQAYYVAKEWLSLFADTTFLGNVTTNIATLVDTGVEAFTGLRGSFAERTERDNDQMAALTALLGMTSKTSNTVS